VGDIEREISNNVHEGTDPEIFQKGRGYTISKGGGFHY
jgi:hypothetical protein